MTDQLRDQIAALFRSAPGAGRLGDEPPGTIADAVIQALPGHVARLMEANERLRADRDVLLWLHAEADWKAEERLGVADRALWLLVEEREAADKLRGEIDRLRREVEFEARALTPAYLRCGHDPVCACATAEQIAALRDAGFSPPQCSVHTEPPKVSTADVAGIFGPGWTGGMSSVDWIRAQRDDDPGVLPEGGAPDA